MRLHQTQGHHVALAGPVLQAAAQSQNSLI